MKIKKRWSTRFDCCIVCNTDSSPHHARGACRNCYNKQYRLQYPNNNTRKGYWKDYWLKNKDQVMKQQKEYKLKNKSKIKKKQAEYRLKNKDNLKAYELINKDKIKEYHKEYFLKNRERMKEQQREYRLRNHGLINTGEAK